MKQQQQINRENLYYRYSTYLKEKYGEKVYKLPVNLPLSCPNRRDNNQGGCIFCADVGTGFESGESFRVKEQMEERKAVIQKKYKASKFIVYYQNYTNTYMPLDLFKQVISEGIHSDVVEIDISTRPDCISSEQLDFLEQIKKDHGVEITFELGLQTVNYHTLDKIHRGHGLGEFIDAVRRIHERGFEICTHLILNLPWDENRDVVESAKVLSALKVRQVKLHALYIMDGTLMGEMYKRGEFQVCTMEEYKEKVILFLRHLDPGMVVQRLIGRAPEENSLFVNWNQSWWKIRDEIEETMENEKYRQGDLFQKEGGSR